ncbi:MAG: SDR family oxidoreductase [Planctomycetota bacterium]|nr:SDR family oxidoreductase [Planctomycetota bacterium]
MSRPVALVTGASSGIGLSFAQELARRGYDLVLVARRVDRLEQVAQQLKQDHSIDCRVEPRDLADPDSIRDLVMVLDRDQVEVEVLINNAGYGLAGSFLSQPWQRHEDFIRVMLTAVCELTYRLLPSMKKRGKGRIIQVSSVAGFLPGTAGHTLYGAVKAALNLFTECLSLECRGSGVNVTSLCPGFTHTEFHDVNGTRQMMSRMPGILWLHPDRVAREALDCCDLGKVYCVPGIVYRLLLCILGLIPSSLRRSIVAAQGSSFRDSSEAPVQST